MNIIHNHKSQIKNQKKKKKMRLAHGRFYIMTTVSSIQQPPRCTAIPPNLGIVK